MDLTDSDLGCWVDGGHTTTIDFMYNVINLANRQFGFEIDSNILESDIHSVNSGNMSEDDFYDMMDSLDWTFYDSIDFMNSIVNANGYFFYVEDQSLFLDKDRESLDPTDAPW